MDLQRQANPKRVGPTTLTTSAVTQFTADKRYVIERWSIANWSATEATISLHVVTSGGSVGNSNKIIGELTIAANDHTTIELPIILEIGETISALASAESAINLTFNVNNVEMGIQ